MAVQREYLSPNEVAELLGVSPFTIRRYIKMGELKAVKLLGGFRVHRNNLEQFLKAHEVNPAEEQLTPEEIEANASRPDAPVVMADAEVALEEAGLVRKRSSNARELKKTRTSRTSRPLARKNNRRTSQGRGSKSL